MDLARHPLILAGERALRAEQKELFAPFDGRSLGSVSQATLDDAAHACKAAAEAFAETRRLSSWQRAGILTRAAGLIAERSETLAQTISSEAAKPIRDARGEVQRATETFRVAAEEARRIGGDLLPLDWTQGTEGYAGFVRRFPVGVVLGITPFNFPLNLVAHKLAPAIAAGCPMLIKPAPQTPLTALALGDIVLEAGWPAGALSVLPCADTVAAALLASEQVQMLSFTGSAAVGWKLRASAGRKRVVLELGGNAAIIVHSDADVELAAARIVAGGFAYSGQSCISAQRIFAHASIYPELVERLRAGIAKLVVGDPADEATQVGPMINEAAAVRAQSWIQEAAESGAQLVTGGGRRGNLLEPTLLTGVHERCALSAEEVFAPVLFVNAYQEFAGALAAVNRSRYGLQAAVFTTSWERMTEAWQTLEVGAVVINQASSWRAEHMPYGGVKDSGAGREGVRYAIEEMTEPRMMIAKL
jgi:glyceraldehyde-3-phosphate dehydrogenase (NADP+)